MILDNPINEDYRIQSLGMKFNSIVEENKLIIQATCEGDNSQYTGKVIQNEHLSFNQVLEYLEDRTFAILSKNQDILKLKIMHQEVELYSILKLELNELKETTKALNQRQDDFRLMIHAQIDEMNKLKYEIKKMEFKELKDDVKKPIERKEEFHMIIQTQNDSIEDVKDEMNKIKVEIKKTTEEIKKINKDSFISEMIKITTQINEIKNQTNKSIELMSNDWKTKLNDQEKKIIKNSGDIDKLMKEIEKLSNLFGIEVYGKLVYENNKEEKINELEKKEEKKNENIVKEPEEKPEVIEYKWSEQLRSDAIKINGNIVTKTKRTIELEFCLLNASFSNTIKSKQSWAIKIKKMTNWIYLGVCLKSEMINYNFNSENINWEETGHGLYMIGSDGGCLSHSEKEFNWVEKSFKFGDNDVINVEYDPIDSKLRFSKNKNKVDKFELSIIAPPENDTYHPCVELLYENDSVELIKPEEIDKCIFERPKGFVQKMFGD